MSHIDQITRSLPVKFSTDELRQKAEQLAEKVSRKSDLEAEKKQVTSDYKGRIESVDAEIATLARHVTQKQEYQMVQCSMHLDQPKYGEKTLIRSDTGETVGTETMTPSDRQMVMQFDRESGNNPSTVSTPEPEEVDPDFDPTFNYEPEMSPMDGEGDTFDFQAKEAEVKAKRSHKKKEKP